MLPESEPLFHNAMERLGSHGLTVIIIVVVIGALIALGLLSIGINVSKAPPCTPISGFTCNNPVMSQSGYMTLAFGVIGMQMNITGTACTSGEPPSLFVSSHAQLNPGNTATLVFQCQLSSNAIGSQFTGDLFIEYNSGNKNNQLIQFAKITAKVSTNSAVVPSLPAHYAQIKLTNAQGSATPAPFQQEVIVSPSAYSGYEANDLGNLRFYSGATELYSWCESGCAASSANVIFWVRLSNSIAANSNAIINIYFEPPGLNYEYDANYAGEAPQLSPLYYSQYDNGANVFAYYYNYVGTAKPLGLAIAGDGAQGSVTFSNRATLRATNTNGITGEFLYIPSRLVPSNYVIEAYILSGTTDIHDKLIGWDAGSPTSQGVWWGWVNGVVAGLHDATEVVTLASGNRYNQNGNGGSVGPTIVSAYWQSSSNFYATFNYGGRLSVSSGLPQIAPSYPVIGFTSDGGTVTYLWGRIRAYPPNGVMPSVSFAPFG